MTKFQFLKHYDFVGYPMVDTRAKFHIPGVFGDDVEIQTVVTEVKRSSFSVEHRILMKAARWRSRAGKPGCGWARTPPIRKRSSRSRSRRMWSKSCRTRRWRFPLHGSSDARP